MRLVHYTHHQVRSTAVEKYFVPEIFDASGQKYFVCFPLVHSVTCWFMAMWIIVDQPHEMIVCWWWQCGVLTAGQARLD